MQGVRYKGQGTPSDRCKTVIVKDTVIKATCVGTAVTLAPPFTGEVGAVLSFGSTDRYCARFGGNIDLNTNATTRRRKAPAPGACP